MDPLLSGGLYLQSALPLFFCVSVLGEITGGDTLLISQTTPKIITEATVNLLLGLMG